MSGGMRDQIRHEVNEAKAYKTRNAKFHPYRKTDNATSTRDAKREAFLRYRARMREKAQ